MRAMDFFQPSKDDPLLAEHQAILRWVQDATGSGEYYRDIQLNAFPSGKAILEADATQARRYVLAALAQTGLKLLPRTGASAT